MSKIIDPNSSTPQEYIVKCVSNGGTTATYPVAVYFDNSGVRKCITAAVDVGSNPWKWGQPISAVDDGADVDVMIFGELTFASGGTAGEAVTAIDATGVITDAAVADGNADDMVAVSTSSTEVLKINFEV